MNGPLATGAGLAVLGAGGYAYAAMSPESQIFGRTLIAGNDTNELALTYDDGPNDEHTEALLDLLEEHSVRATFFLIGRFVRQRTALVRAIHERGHLVGNHTFTHPVLLFQPPGQVRQQLASCNAAIEDAIGAPVRYFRPPHGARRPDVVRYARSLGLTPVMWNAMGYDWKPSLDPARILADLERGIAKNRRRGRGSNLLLHDGGQAGLGQDRRATVEATRQLLGRYSEARFVTVDVWNQGSG